MSEELYIVRRRGRTSEPYTLLELRSAVERGNVARFDEIAVYDPEVIEHSWSPADAPDLKLVFKVRHSTASDGANDSSGEPSKDAKSGADNAVHGVPDSAFGLTSTSRNSSRRRWRKMALAGSICALAAVVTVAIALMVLNRSDPRLVANDAATSEQAAKVATGLLLVGVQNGLGEADNVKAGLQFVECGTAFAISPNGYMLCAASAIDAYEAAKTAIGGRDSLRPRLLVVLQNRTYNAEFKSKIGDKLALVQLRLQVDETLPRYFSLLDSDNVNSPEAITVVDYDTPAVMRPGLFQPLIDERILDAMKNTQNHHPSIWDSKDRDPRVSRAAVTKAYSLADSARTHVIEHGVSLTHASAGSPILISGRDGGLVVAGVNVMAENSDVPDSAVMPVYWKSEICRVVEKVVFQKK